MAPCVYRPVEDKYTQVPLSGPGLQSMLGRSQRVALRNVTRERGKGPMSPAYITWMIDNLDF